MKTTHPFSGNGAAEFARVLREQAEERAEAMRADAEPEAEEER